MSPDANLRVRFAPSPTGDVHIGGIWMAQFDWLLARQRHGQFVLRIEDTDRQRLVPGAIEKIYEALEWYGLIPDEGPNRGGAYGPYIQSQRLDVYHRHVRQLIKQGNAYYCFCPPKRLEQLRAEQQAAKRSPRYDKHCLTIPADEVQARLKRGEPAVIRLKVPTAGTISFDDIVRGKVAFSLDQIDDSILLKSDGWPTYHLAVVVDDHLMKISHVLRAEEWLSSTPKHLLLYQAFGWAPPKFAHLPQILGANKKKLSKREGAASALGFRDEGYLVEAVRNFLALMGWHPKGDDEIMPLDEIVKQFRLEAMNPSGAIFDRTKLNWLNGLYIRRLPLEELRRRLEPWWTMPPDKRPSDEWQRRALAIVRDRMTVLADVNDLTRFLFRTWWDEDRQKFDQVVLKPKRLSLEETQDALRWAQQWLDREAGGWTVEALKPAMLSAIGAAGLTNMAVLWPLRVAISLRPASPDVFDLLALLGKEESLRRVKTFLQP